MSRIVYYAAVSADGFIADREGGVDWLEPFPSAQLGYDDFLGRVGAVVMGRTTYEQMLTFGPWPYGRRPGLVVTSRPIDGLPPGVKAIPVSALPARLPALAVQGGGDTWIVGGASTAGACMEAGLVDELELYVVPRLLGKGVRLLDRAAGLVALRTEDTRAFENGIVMLRYVVER
jgi:dihydrofolate reductase